MPPIVPSGNKAPVRSDRNVETPGASVKFSTDLGVDGFRAVPGLVVDARHITDPSPKNVGLSSESLATIKDIATLEAAVKEGMEKNKDHLDATDIEGKNERLGVSGLRKQAFFANIRSSLGDTELSTADKRSAFGVLKGLEERTYMDRDIIFDTGKLDTYHPYGKPFDKGVRKIEGLAPPGVERDAITAELDYITDRKTKRGWGKIDERDAEKTLGLRPVDRGNDGATISLAKNSESHRPSYVVMNVAKDGLPADMQEHAGKAVFRDGDKYYFDKSATEVPAELTTHINEKPVSDKLGLRNMESGETARADFPYDWNRNSNIDVDKIDTSWWGHCHIEAPLAALSLNAGSKVTIFDTRSSAEKSFSNNDVNDLLFAMFDADRYADINTSRPAYVESTTFVGNRNDTIGAPLPGDKLIFDVGGREMPFNVKFREVAPTETVEPAEGEAEVAPPSVDDLFQPTKVTEGIKFDKNPEFEAIRDRDWSTIDGDRKVVANIQYLDVNAQGVVARENAEVTIDPANPSEEPVLLGSELSGGGYPPSVTRYYLNQETNKIESKRFTPEKQDDGTYKMVGARNARTVGSVRDITLSRELTKESIIELHDHVLDAARRGVSFVTEKSSGHSVWNYGTNGMRLDRVEEDGDFVKYRMSLDTQGGNKSWDYILKYDASGNAVDAHAIGAPADFVFRPERSLSVPVYRDPNSNNVLFNSSAYERGFLVDGHGRINDESMSFFRYASDVIYASLEDPSVDHRYAVIDENGDMFFYDDEESYKADVRKIAPDSEAAQVPEPETTPDAGEVTTPVAGDEATPPN